MPRQAPRARPAASRWRLTNSTGEVSMRKWIKRFATLLVALLLLTVGATWWALNGSLASIDGELTLSGLSAPVCLQRDHNGVLSIQAGNEADAMRSEEHKSELQ